MNIIKGISKYILILIIWCAIAFFVAWIQYDTTDLAASVLSLTEQSFFESTKRDAGYKKENQIFEVFLAEQVRNEWPLTVSILFSPDIKLSLDEIESDYNISNIQQNEWNLMLNIDWHQNGDFSEWIFQIPYSGSAQDITLEYIKSQNNYFSIWSLDDITDDNHH